MARCTRVTWRGVIVCKHSVPKYNAWAASVASVTTLRPLAGCGSYQTSTAASAGTHAGGGAIDIDLRNVSAANRKWIADKGRLSGLNVAWHRNYVAGLWSSHCHSIDPSCPNLARAAAAQVIEFRNGGDGLVGSGRDTNTRANVPQLYGMYLNRFATAIFDAATAIVSDINVKNLQAAVHQTVDGIWGEQTDIDLRNTGSEATRRFSGVFFKSWNTDQKKRMQKSWGVAQDGIWGPTTAAGAKNTTIKIQKALGVTADGLWGPVTTTAYFNLRDKAYKGSFSRTFPYPYGQSAPKPAFTNYDAVNMDYSKGIDVSQLKPGVQNNPHVARLQSAIWNWRGPDFKHALVAKYGLHDRTPLYSGDYNEMTKFMVQDSYNLLMKLEPNGGWTSANTPGPGFLKRIGFKTVF